MSDTAPEPSADAPDTAPEGTAPNAPEPELPADMAAAFDSAPIDMPADATTGMMGMGAPVDDTAGMGVGVSGPDAVATVSEDAEPGTAGVVISPSGEAAAVVVGDDKGGGGAATVGVAPGLTISENVGPSTIVYKRSPSLKADKALVKKLVTDERFLSLWNEIGELEAGAAQLKRGSQLLVTELIDRLSTARNRLLHSKDQYENALREVVYVRYRLTRIQHSSLLEQPQTILVYLIILLVAIVAGFFFTPTFIANLFGAASAPPAEGPAIAGIDALTLFNTAFWGALGGLAAAFFALQRHVEDFDQQHARWYYLSPMVGLFIGPLMGLVAGLGIPALFQMVSEAPANVDIRPALLYLLAWTVGYQQNLLLELVRSVLKRVLPEPAPESPKTDPPIR